jgi:hypothetical protein
MFTIAVIIVIGAAIVLFMPTKLGILLKGFYGLFIKNIAKTPEGASAIYEEAINKAQNRYNSATDALQRIAGQFDTAKRNQADVTLKLKDIEAKAEKMAQTNQFDKVTLLSEERAMLLEELASHDAAIKELEPAMAESKQLTTAMEKELVRLKKEKVMVVDSLRRNIQLKEMYDRMDELKRNTNLDKMVGAVREGNQENRELAAGAKTVHEGKLSTRLERISSEASSLAANEYVEQLKQKYGQQTQGTPGTQK